MNLFKKKGMAYVLSQGMFTASSAIIIVILSSQGDSANVVKFGIYFSLLAILQSTLSLRYELGLYTDGGKNKDFSLYTAIINSIFISSIIVIAVTLLKYLSVSIWNFGISETILIVLTCSVANICMVLKQYYVVSGATHTITKINASATFIIFITLFIAQFTPEHFVFRLFLISYISVYSFLIVHWLVSFKRDEKYTLSSYYGELVKGSEFLKYSTPGMLLNLLGQNILILYFGVIGDTVEFAQLVVIMRVVFLPLSLLLLPLNHVISARVTSYIANGTLIFGFICRVLGALLLSSIIYCFALFLIGSSWLKIIGIEVAYWNSYLPILAVLVLFRMTISPVSNVLNVLKKEKLLFSLQLFNALIIVVIFLEGPRHVVDGLWIYSIGAVVFQLLILTAILRASRLSDRVSGG